MKAILMITVLMLITSLVNAQDISYTEVATAKKGKIDSYTSKNGTVYKPGDKIKIGKPFHGNTFTFITQGDGLLTPIEILTSSAMGEQVEIKSVWVSGLKKSGFFVSIWAKSGTISGYGINLEKAIESGEIVSNVMTSDEALTELKKAKDKLDLGLITAEQYEKIKSELSKIIN